MTDKETINLFIDTNILLDSYRYSNDDLEKLNQLEDLFSPLCSKLKAWLLSGKNSLSTS